MKHRFCLLLPLILISACNGSDSKTDDSVSRSTFDAVSAELGRTKDELARALNDKAALEADQAELRAIIEKLNQTIASNIDELDRLRAIIDGNPIVQKQIEDLTKANSQLIRARDEAIEKLYQLAKNVCE